MLEFLLEFGTKHRNKDTFLLQIRFLTVSSLSVITYMLSVENSSSAKPLGIDKARRQEIIVNSMHDSTVGQQIGFDQASLRVAPRNHLGSIVVSVNL